MDDFLHNLRSGKLKQQDRGRSYNDPQFKGGQRRNQDRRKKEMEAIERLNAVKDVLESIAETQKRMAEAYEARTRTENRKAYAMETLAKNIYRMLNPDAQNIDELFAPEPEYLPEPQPQPIEEVTTPPEEEVTTPPEEEVTTPPETVQAKDKGGNSKRKLSDEERQTLSELIGSMRDDGKKWSEIARHIESQDYPTVSGKGTWRGVMVKNLYEKISQL